MAIYDWRGRNNRGEAVDGQLEAMTEGGVADQLKAIGVVPVFIAPAKAVAEAQTESWFDRLNRKPIVDEPPKWGTPQAKAREIERIRADRPGMSPQRAAPAAMREL